MWLAPAHCLKVQTLWTKQQSLSSRHNLLQRFASQSPYQITRTRDRMESKRMQHPAELLRSPRCSCLLNVVVVWWKLLNDCHLLCLMCDLSTEQSRNKPGIMRSAARPGCPRNLQVTLPGKGEGCYGSRVGGMATA